MGSLTPCSDFLDSQENPLLVGVVTCGGVCEFACVCVHDVRACVCSW